MLDLKFIRENAEKVKQAIKDKKEKVDLDEILKLDEIRRKVISRVEKLKSEKNVVSREIGDLLRQKKKAEKKIDETKKLTDEIKSLDNKLLKIAERLDTLLLTVPNIPHESVPVGAGSDSNKVVKSRGEPRRFDFKPLTHMDLADSLGIIDFARGAKITGRAFPLYIGQGARLERALINFMLDLHTGKHGYIEVFPPYLVNRASMINTGQLPKLEDDMYRLRRDDYFLIPTGEVPLTNINAGEILEEKDLPRSYAAYTACFRREAGSYGKNTVGLTRVHQFNKVELVKLVKPESSYEELEKLLVDAEEIVQLLGLPYRISLLSTGDLSFAGTKCYDIETWAPGLERYLEISSCSNFEDFQARRANIKYRRDTEYGIRNTEYVHTLNGSGVALARTVIALLENYQNKDGSITIPEVLCPYMDGMEKIEKNK
ncbi:MAG: serine--tRNA ligase [Candidatus Ratteibacteria bacterium]|nr:serine--tRNA ligase [Candidatus Ratteibacteria bacterium]